MSFWICRTVWSLPLYEAGAFAGMSIVSLVMFVGDSMGDSVGIKWYLCRYHEALWWC